MRKVEPNAEFEWDFPLMEDTSVESKYKQARLEFLEECCMKHGVA